MRDTVETLYHHIIDAWNARNADNFAACFVDDGHIVGFDGSMMDSAASIAQHLGEVFGSHQTASYITRVREVRQIGADSAMLRAVVGMVPPDGNDLNPAVNSVQTLIAERHGDEWRGVMLQTTPAQFHGRPDLAEALTNELRALLPGRAS
jgi:uncharacterized protein (TIGR02246 family)